MPQAQEIRIARALDLPAIVALLADDTLGAARERNESPVPESYRDAFAAIEADHNNGIIVAEREGRVVAVLQLTIIPNLTYRGGTRGLFEGVLVAADCRSRGIGETLMRWAMERVRARGCVLVQPTSDKRRPETIRFYMCLGFEDSHVGLKRYWGTSS